MRVLCCSRYILIVNSCTFYDDGHCICRTFLPLTDSLIHLAEQTFMSSVEWMMLDRVLFKGVVRSRQCEVSSLRLAGRSPAPGYILPLSGKKPRKVIISRDHGQIKALQRWWWWSNWQLGFTSTFPPRSELHIFRSHFMFMCKLHT